MARHTSLKFRRILAGMVVCIVFVTALWFFITGLESTAPGFVLDTPQEVFGASSPLTATALDGQSGLKRVWMAIVQNGQEVIVLDRHFPTQGLVIPKGPKQHRISVNLNPADKGLKDGKAMLRISVWDCSWKGWGKGNQFYEERPIRFDTTSPTITMGTRTHNLNQGGAGLAIFKTSEPVKTAGIQVGDRFFKALQATPETPDTFICYFALPRPMGSSTRIHATAEDDAGNTGTATFYYYINEKKFKKDTIRISDGFLKRKLPEFSSSVDWGDAAGSYVESFIMVNRTLRNQNYTTIRRVCSQSDGQRYWSGPFLRLPASAKKAGFGEHRIYLYNDEVIDEQTHQGIDLASTAQAPVPASNGGKVVFAEDLGIYGKTVIIDHGFFLFTMYSHLSQITALKGNMVSKGEIVGRTGSTGMAGGDHLHFGVLIAHTFVNPLEWWDPNWIKHNVTDKMNKAHNFMSRGKKEAAG